jgi:alpha-beta hydrolase superfamily lysophospholipase
VIESAGNTGTNALRRRPRWARILTRVIVLFVVVHVIALGAASWYYSSKIESDALHVRPGVWEQPFTVGSVDVEASGATATLHLLPAPGAAAAAWQRRDLLTMPLQGLYWDGGRAQTDGPARALGADPATGLDVTVTRADGTWPAVGATIGSHTFAFGHGIVAPWQKVAFPGPQGPLDAAYWPAEGRTWAVMVHGKGAAPDEFTRLAQTTHALGMPSLAITYRGDVGMPAEPDDRYGFGINEWPDAEAAVTYAVAQGAQDVVLVGASMGGAIVASYLRHAKDTSAVRAVILEAPALHLARVVDQGASQVALPGGITLPGVVTWGAQRLTTVRFGLDWEAADYLTDTSWCDRPTLVLHGDADLTVPVSISRDLASSCGEVTLVETPGAGHVASWNMDRSRYEQAVTDFLTPLR